MGRQKKNKLKRIGLIIIIIIQIISSSFVIGTEENNITENISGTYQLTEYLQTLEEYVKSSGVETVDLNQISQDLINSKGINYESIISKLLSIFSKELVLAIKGGITIYMLVIVMAIISSIQLDKDSSIVKIAHLACFLTLSTITITTFLEMISLFKNIIGVLTTTMQVVSPFMMAILIATGSITSTGIIQPLLLFLASAVGFLVNYIVVPFFSISVAFNVITSISENLRLDKMSKMFPSIALWTTGVALTLFLGILSMETSITSSVDALAVKTTQSAVSNFIPVVGKFFSDSLEAVVGATQIIGKVGGTLGILTIIVVSIIPILKIASIMAVYSLLAALVEPIYSDERTIKYISNFANMYKTLLGILIGVVILFVISTGIILNLVGSVVK